MVVLTLAMPGAWFGMRNHLDSDVIEKMMKIKYSVSTPGKWNVFGFASAKGYFRLDLADPMNEAARKGDEIAGLW